MMDRLIIIGASGHGKVVADIAVLCGYRDIVFLDDYVNAREIYGFDVKGKVDLLDELQGDVFVAIGNSVQRESIMSNYSGRYFPTLIHPNSIVAQSATIGAGSIVVGGAVVNPDAIIGKGCIINTMSSVDHDCAIGDYVHIAVGAHLCGGVVVGDNCWIGAGCVINQQVHICENTIIGSGAVVLKNITEDGTYVGVPAKKI